MNAPLVRALGVAAFVALACSAPGAARAGDAPDSIAAGAAPSVATPPAAAAPSAPHIGRDGLEHLVPELEGNPYRLAPGVRPYQNRVSFSPAFGNLGSNRVFAFRFAFNPNEWLGYEGTLSHNPGHSVHALLHTLSALVRRPRPGRLQPYLSAGYGMMIVFPGPSLNADAVTKNALTYGGGLEWYIRGDLALRGEVTQATVFGSQRDRDGLVAYDYLQETIGLAFYRSLRP
ncbi:MAG TPA: hypothetical protein VL332_08420 [Candidatus Saccharimonadaceae bacterium]|nr:hypothetical protein [Candidatus Saccharimonadaceae bacterium]